MFEKKKVLSALKEIVIAGLASFVLYLFIMFYIGNFMSETSQELRFAVAKIAMLLFFTFSYGFVHMRKRKEDYMLNMSADAPFDFKGEYIGFLKTEGKYILAIFVILAVIAEVSLFVWPLISSKPGNPIYTALAPIFMIGALIENIPIIRSVLPIALDIPLMALFVVFRKRSIYKEYKKK